MSISAQEEFNSLVYNSTNNQNSNTHLEDPYISSDNDSTTLNSAFEDEAVFTSTQAVGMPSATYHLPRTADFNANTGPKGVIADARSFETARKRGFRQTLHVFSNGPSPPLFTKSNKPAFDFSREKSASPDLSADDEEDGFMRAWRANRMDELTRMSHSQRTRRHSPSQRRYGTLVTVDPSGYLDALEKVHADTVVVVLIYDEASSSVRLTKTIVI